MAPPAECQGQFAAFASANDFAHCSPPARRRWALAQSVLACSLPACPSTVNGTSQAANSLAVPSAARSISKKVVTSGAHVRGSSIRQMLALAELLPQSDR